MKQKPKTETMGEQPVKLRSKGEILESLPRAIKQSDKDHVKKIFPAHGNMVKNAYPNPDNPATWIGWARLEDGNVIRLEGETRVSKSGKKSLALKVLTLSEAQAVEMELSDPKIPDYVSQETQDFLDQ